MSIQKSSTSSENPSPQISTRRPVKRQIDLNLLAEKIFQLLKKEARLERERQGSRRQ